MSSWVTQAACLTRLASCSRRRGTEITWQVIFLMLVKRDKRLSVARRRCDNYGFRAGRGLELLRISDSGVSVAGLPLKMTRFGFSASVSTSSLA